MRFTKANGYKNTGYEMMVCMTTYAGIYRTVYKKNGKYFVSYNGSVYDVTEDAKNGLWLRKNR